MEFMVPKMIYGEIKIKIEVDDFEVEVKFWESAFIMYVLRDDRSMKVVKEFMMKNWNFVKLPDMFYNNDGYFILCFHSFKAKDIVLMKGPYTIHNRPMLL